MIARASSRASPYAKLAFALFLLTPFQQVPEEEVVELLVVDAEDQLNPPLSTWPINLPSHL